MSQKKTLPQPEAPLPKPGMASKAAPPVHNKTTEETAHNTAGKQLESFGGDGDGGRGGAGMVGRGGQHGQAGGKPLPN